MTGKQRLDLFLVENGYFETRSKAKRAIMAGKIIVNHQMIDKAGTVIGQDSVIEIKGSKIPYVSRGGLKLKKALDVFLINPEGKEAIDIGASTGGFTDCLLQYGASKVYAIDVGYGQLAWKLRQDDRVEVIERTNFRYLTPAELPVEVPLIVTDVSFISLELIIPPALNFLKKKGDFVALIKPQFEAGPENVGKKGLIKNSEVHVEVISNLSRFIDKLKLRLLGLDSSPITGASSKNIEFLLHLQKDENVNNDLERWNQKIEEVVKKAHEELIKK